MTKPMRWARAKRTGRHTGPEVHELRQGGVVLARVQACAGGWFWYGANPKIKANTSHIPGMSLDGVKHQAVAEVKRQLGVTQ